MDWFEGKSTENHSFTQQQSGFPANFPWSTVPKNQRGQYVWEDWEPHKYQKQDGFLIDSVDVSDFEDPGTGR